MFFIYTPDRELVGILEGYQSIIWMRRYHSPGAFELTMPFLPICEDLIAERLIVKGDEAGIIENIHIEQNKTGENVFKCSGRFLSSYFDRRILLGVNSKTDTPENVMRHLVTKNTAGDRAIQGLAVAAASLGGTNIAYLSEKENLLEELQALSEAYGVGFKVEFASTGLTFKVYAGKDRTIEQSTNSRAIFSKEFENILKQEYDGSMKAVRNLAYVEAEQVAKTLIYDAVEDVMVETMNITTLTRTVGSVTGRDRREIFVDAGDVSMDEDNVLLTIEQQQAAIDAAGVAAMVDKTEAFSADVDPYGNLRYQTDYDLGDIVTVDSRELGMRVNARITEIKEVYESEGLKLNLILGYGIPTFAKQVRWLING